MLPKALVDFDCNLHDINFLNLWYIIFKCFNLVQISTFLKYRFDLERLKREYSRKALSLIFVLLSFPFELPGYIHSLYQKQKKYMNIFFSWKFPALDITDVIGCKHNAHGWAFDLIEWFLHHLHLIRSNVDFKI